MRILASFFILMSSSIGFAQFTPVCDRSQSVREELEWHLQKPCAEISEELLNFWAGPEYGDKLYISVVDPLKTGDFSGLAKIRKMELGFLYTQGVEIPRGTFVGMSNLEELRIKGGARVSAKLEEGSFTGLDSLKLLEFFQTSLGQLPARLLINLPRLEEVEFFENLLTYIDANLFDGAPSIKKLHLLGCCFDHQRTGPNRLNALPKGLLDPLVNLEWLDLRELGLDQIAEDTFAKNKKLKYLDLSKQNLSDLPTKIFSSHKNLESLNLELAIKGIDGAIFRFPPELLAPLVSLRWLKLSGYSYLNDNILLTQEFFDLLPVSLRELYVYRSTLKISGRLRLDHLINLRVGRINGNEVARATE